MKYVIVFFLYVSSREWLFPNEELLFIFSFLMFVYALYAFAGTAFSASLDSQIEEIRQKFMSVFVLRQKELEEEISKLHLTIKVDQVTYLLSASAINLFLSMTEQYPAVKSSFSQKVKSIGDAVFVEHFDQTRKKSKNKQKSFLARFLTGIRKKRVVLLSAALKALKLAFIRPKLTRNSFEKSVLAVSTLLPARATDLVLLNALAYKGLLSVRDARSLRPSRSLKPSQGVRLSINEARRSQARKLAKSFKRRLKLK